MNDIEDKVNDIEDKCFKAASDAVDDMLIKHKGETAFYDPNSNGTIARDNLVALIAFDKYKKCISK